MIDFMLLDPKIKIDGSVIGWVVAAVIGGTAAVRGIFKLSTRNFVKWHKLDELRTNTEERYVSKEMCEERSGNIVKKLDEICRDVKTLLKVNSRR